MRKGRPIPVMTVTTEERETLERWAGLHSLFRSQCGVAAANSE